jgi:hypothetical protein
MDIYTFLCRFLFSHYTTIQIPQSSVNFFYIGMEEYIIWAYIDTQTYIVSKTLLDTTMFILKREKMSNIITLKSKGR